MNQETVIETLPGQLSTVNGRDIFSKDCRPTNDPSSVVRSLLGVGFETAFGSAALVAEELGVHALGVAVPLALWLFDTVLVLLARLIVGGMVLRLCHIYYNRISIY